MKLAKKSDMPMVPLRDLVVFPAMVVPFFVGRKRSVKAIEEANNKGKIVFLTTQKTDMEDEPSEKDVCQTGTVAKILQMLKLPDGTIRVLVEGTERAGIVRFTERGSLYKVTVKPIEESSSVDAKIEALIRAAKTEFTRYARYVKKLPKKVASEVERIETPDKLVNTVCSGAPLKVEHKMELLSLTDPTVRLERLVAILIGEAEVLELERRINSKVRKRLEKNQKQYFLNEQLKEIQKELGRDRDDPTGARELKRKLKEKGLPEKVLAKCLKEVGRLARLQPISPETGVLSTYLEWICDLPWKEFSTDNRDIDEARRILDQDHYGLRKVKERILDFIAVRQLKEKVRGPILCFVGPPGTGKTSLGQSVARSLNREFVRVSLGGVRDEAEIRGHRKTYIGALPGKIIQSMRNASTRNPVFLLDEIDKMSSDFRGDPASAMLEVLDPEQNSTFTDHYLEVQYDLSDVMFITTANSVHNIPYALRDRMEIIEISGYTEDEKVKIAEQFLIPKQREENGLAWAEIKFQKSALHAVIQGYTMESGVRSLEREIANIMRKLARRAVKQGASADSVDERQKQFSATITPGSVKKHLGRPRYQEMSVNQQPSPGLAHGLAWTELGGTLLPVEIVIIKGTGDLVLTGNLGNVMKESARAALSFLRSHTASFAISDSFHEDRDIHVHVPEGAIPKDGPSAGITITAALLSAVTGRIIPKGLAMTGEITLTGQLLPVGGIKEKVLAARRNKMTHVLMPELNRNDAEDLPKAVAKALSFIFAGTIEEALRAVFPGLADDGIGNGARAAGDGSQAAAVTD